MARTRNRRRRYLVNKPLQLQLIGLLALLGATPVVIFGVSLYIVNKTYLLTMQKLIGDGVFSDVYIQGILRFSAVALVTCFIISSALMVFIALRFSHHIAGPLYRLGNNLARLARGERVEPVHFRKNDIINGLAANFNAVVKRIQNK